MSRSGYTDDCDDMWGVIRWRGAVASAIRGKRGQAALREIAAALDAMPVKELAGESLVTAARANDRTEDTRRRVLDLFGRGADDAE